MFHQSILEPAQLPSTAHTPRLSHPEHSRIGDPGWLSPHPWSTEKGRPPTPNSIFRRGDSHLAGPGGACGPAALPTRLAAPGALSLDPTLLGAELDFLLATQMLGQRQRADLPDFIPGPVLEGRSLFSTPSSRILRLFFFFFHYFSK